MKRPLSRHRLAAVRRLVHRAAVTPGHARRLLAAVLCAASAASAARGAAAQTVPPVPPDSPSVGTHVALTERASAPAPTLAPEQVVAIVLDALSHNDVPSQDRGVAVTFAFASPSNRAVLGSVDRLGDMVRGDTYRPLLYHRRAEAAPVKLDGDKATQRVVVTTLDGELVAYTFSLSRQTDGAYKGCWMTDGVTREPRSRARALSLAAGGTAGATSAPRGD